MITRYANKYYNKTTEGQDVVETLHAYANGQLIATAEDDGTDFTLYYDHTDHLGGTSVMTNEDGEVEQIVDYYPFGDIRFNQQINTFDEQRKFTGHEYDGTTDLTYMNARYYAGVAAKFISQDNIFQELGSERFFKLVDKNYQGENDKKKDLMEKYISNPQSLNSYLYGKNNPLNRIDPTGNIDVHSKNATSEQKKEFNEALSQLQVSVANNSEIQSYFKLFGININEALKDNGMGADVYIGRENKTNFNSKGNYNSFWNDIDIYSNAFTDINNVQHTLMHEMGHWANDVGKWWGDLNPNVSQFKDANNTLNTYKRNSTRFEIFLGFDSAYGFMSEIITFGKIR